MFQKVLVPLDGSKMAEKVLHTVRQIAQPSKTEIVLMRNVDQSAYALISDSPVVANRLFDSVQTETRKYLAQQKAVLERDGYGVHLEISRGDTAAAIIQVADDLNADLVAMTTHGRTGIGRMTLGSVADRVVRSAHLPILLVRAASPKTDKETIQKILLPLDGSVLSEQALPIARAVARDSGGSVLLLKAIEALEDIDLAELYNHQVDEHGIPTDWQNEAHLYLERMQKKLTFADVSSDYHVIVGRPAEAILHVAEQESCDLVVMSTHGRSGIGRWVYGSVASKVLHETECPLLLVRGHVREEADEVAPGHVVEIST